MGAVLNVVRGPEAFRRDVITLVKQCLECFEHDCLISFWGRVAHCFSCACNGLLCTFTTVEYDRTPEVARYFRKISVEDPVELRLPATELTFVVDAMALSRHS